MLQNTETKPTHTKNLSINKENWLGFCGGLNENSPVGSHIRMSDSQMVNYLGRIRRYGHAGENSLGVGFEVSKAQTRHSLSFGLQLVDYI